MIVATAGHIDHGKTLLVKSLTGIDADRLPEERRRGMTIDLGFAYWPVAEGVRIGFVDVPGHERFIRNMLAGVSGIDFALLVVAADDGVMPQTREHAAILDLLGISAGAVALTKIDRADEARVAAVRQEIAELLDGTALAGSPVLPLSNVTGDGIDALKSFLSARARTAPARVAGGNFRLAVDRAFTVTGAGLVVTGAVFAGSVAIGDTVRALNSGRTARVRSIHAQNQAATAGHAGERCALNLAGGELKLEMIERGDWIVATAATDAVRRVDARLRVLPSEARPLAHWTPVHIHIGAAATTGRVALLERSAIAPGETGLAQLVLDSAIGAVHGDRLILRDQSASRTIGGGRVIDIFPPKRGRAQPARLAYLRAMETRDANAALAALVAAAPGGLDLNAFALARNLAPKESDALFAEASMRIAASGERRIGFSAAAWQRAKSVALENLAAFHRRAPNAAGLAEDRLFGGAGLRVAKDAAVAIAAELVAEGAAERASGLLRLASHAPTLAAADAALWRRVEPLIDKTPLRPPTVHEIAAALGEPAQKIESFLVRVARVGLAQRIAPARFFKPSSLRRLAAMAAEIAETTPDRAVAAAPFRDRSGIGRNLAIEVLEYFDRIKFTRRVGDAHRVLRSVEDAFGRPRDG